MKIITALKRGTFNSLVWLDKAVNDHLLFGKWETISARAGKNIESADPNPFAVMLCSFLDSVDEDHCKKSAEAQRAKEMKK